MKPIDCSSAEHYTWLSADEQPCDGWHLHRTPDLSVIRERMPPNTAERRHLHRRAAQFFYVLQGELTMECGGRTDVLRAGFGLSVAAGAPHQVMNRSKRQVSFLVISSPPSHGDRVTVETKTSISKG